MTHMPMAMVGPAPGLRAVRVQTHAALNRLMPDWSALEDIAGCVPLSADLAAHVLRHDPDVDPLVIAVYRGTQLVGALPMRLSRRGGLTLARRLGGVTQPCDGLLVHRAERPGLVAAAALSMLSETPGLALVQFDALPAGDPLLEPGALREVARPRSATFAIDLRGPTPLLARQSKHRRKSIRRRRRQLEDYGPVRLLVATDPEERLALTERALALKLEWLNREGHLAPTFRSSALQRGLRRAAEDSGSGMLVFALMVNDVAAAIEIGFPAGAIYHSYLGAYDHDLARMGPGTALTVEVAEWCRQQGFSTYCLGTEWSAFKESWGDTQRVVMQASWPVSLPGRLAAPVVREGPRLARSLIHALAPYLRRQVA